MEIPNFKFSTRTSTADQFNPTPKDKFFGFFVGAKFEEHYRPVDVHDINIYAPLTWMSAGLATTGMAIALNNYLGVSYLASVFPVAAAYVCMDRAIIRAESIEKADRAYQHLVGDATTFRDRLLSAAHRIAPLSFRLGMAVCTSIITGGVIVTQIANPEVEGMVKAEHESVNRDLLIAKATREKDYDEAIVSKERLIKNWGWSS